MQSIFDLVDLDVLGNIGNILTATQKDKTLSTDFSIHVPLPDREVFDMLELSRYDAVVAGGCARMWWSGHPVGQQDVDLWFSNEKNCLLMIHDLHCSSTKKGMSFAKHHDSENALTYKLESTHGEYTLQFIRRCYDSVDQLLGDFDITVCKIATDGKRWHVGENYISDLATRTLRVVKTHPRIAKRVLKYIAYGFTPALETLSTVINTPDLRIDYSTGDAGDYDAF